MNNQEKLEEILKTMDVPPARKMDVGWLMRNIQIRNSEHPNINQAIDLIKEIQKERKDHE